MRHKGKIIDPSQRDGIPLFWGAHFANDLAWVEEGQTTKSRGRNARRNNAEFRGLTLVALGEIKPRSEIFASYNLAYLK